MNAPPASDHHLAVLLPEHDVAGGVNIDLIDVPVRSAWYHFDISFDETIRRHET